MPSLRVAFIVRDHPNRTTNNMTNDNQTIGRRPVLKGAGATLAALGGVTGSVAAGKGGGKGSGGHLADTTADFVQYWSRVDDEANDPNSPIDFGFPLTAVPQSPINPSNTGDGDWFLAGTDPGNGGGLFDGSTIEITPNHQTLHHSLRFFAGIVMAGKAKTYTLVNLGAGLFESRGQTTNFTARPTAQIQAGLVQAFMAQGIPQAQAEQLAGFLASNPPFSVLAGEKWRAVATERLKVDLSGTEPYDSEWATTRVDFYSRGGGKATYELSLLYTLWMQGNNAAAGQAVNYGSQLITDGRLNPGGQ